MANGREYVNELALELDSMEAPGRRVYLPDPELGATFKEWDRGGASFKDRFSEILTGFAWEEPEPLDRYDALLLSDEETNARKEAQAAAQEEERRKWWEAVQDTVREDTDLFERVQKKCKEALSTGAKWEKIVREVLTDVMLEMEGLEPSEALEYIFKQEFTFFPTLFLLQELLSREDVLFSESRMGNQSALCLAIRSGRVQLVKEFADCLFLHFCAADRGDYSFLHEAAATGSVEMYNLLVEAGEDEKARDKENRTVLHVMAEHNCEELVSKLVAEGKTEYAVQDNSGWTPLHQAVFSDSAAVCELLVQNGSPVNIQDAKGQTPLHIAVEKESMEMMQLLLYFKADAGIADHNNETPLTLALLWQEGFQYLLNHCYEGEGSEAPKKALKQAMEGKKDKRAAEKIRELPHSEVVNMLQHDDSVDAPQGSQELKLKFSFINDFVDNPLMKRSTLAILDHFVLANTCVNSEVMESDPKGCPPDSTFFEPKSKSFLAALSEQGTKDIALHPAVKALIDHKWNSFGWWLFGFLFALYLLRMLVFGAALFIAARPDLDNPGCYRNGWDYARGIFEGISFIFFLYKGYDEISEMFQFKRAYFRDYYNYLQIASVLLPLLIIPFRAATTWCASAGEGYCALPVNTTAMGNTSVSESCIVASSVQWIVASLSYLVNALLIVEYVALFRVTGVYMRILLKILASDMIKFILIFFVVLYIFVGTFYLALRAGVVISADGQIRSDLQLFQLQTLYPWHVLFTGFRILFETGSVLDSYFAADETTGQYVGYQWFSIVLYLVFLFVVIVVLLNLLIAQMSNTYSNIQDEAEGTYAVARARILSRLEKTRIFGCGEPFRKTFYQQLLWNYEITDKDEDRDKHDEKLLSLEKKVDSLAKMMTEIIEFHQAQREGKEAMLEFALPEAPTTPVDDSDSDD